MVPVKPHGRSQCVFFQSSTSAYCETNLGVPQGSVPGPFLFCLYINDLKGCLSITNALRLLNADDLQIYIQVPATKIDIEMGIKQLSDLARLVAVWAEHNHLTLNSKKAKAIIFGTAHTIKLFKDLQTPKITINNTGDQTEFISEITSLGVILDNNLSRKARVNCVSKRVHTSLYGLRFI